jgi:hypothetical protein
MQEVQFVSLNKDWIILFILDINGIHHASLSLSMLYIESMKDINEN